MKNPLGKVSTCGAGSCFLALESADVPIGNYIFLPTQEVSYTLRSCLPGGANELNAHARGVRTKTNGVLLKIGKAHFGYSLGCMIPGFLHLRKLHTKQAVPLCSE